MYARIAAEIAGIAEATPGNVAAFFPSYELLEEVLGRVRELAIGKPLIIERPDWDKAKRDGALEVLRSARPGGGAVLFGVQGGSLSEGVDYEDNLLAAVVLLEGRLLAPRYARCLPADFAPRPSPAPAREVHAFLASA